MVRVTAPVVFVGPSFPNARDAFRSLDVRPPAARGDISRAVNEGATLVGLIDGVFGARQAVTATELREARRAGARILGAASVGALRAAEVPDVVEPVGVIAGEFVRGELTDEDFVACTFDEAYRVLSHPLVNVRAALRRATANERLVEAVLRELGRSPFDERTPQHIAATARRCGGASFATAVRSALAEGGADVKRQDAVTLLRLLEQMALA